MYVDSVFVFTNSFAVYWYGVIMALAAALALATALWLRSVQRRNVNDALLAFVVSMPISLVLARFYYCWSSEKNFSGVSDMLNITNGGFAVPGLVVGVFISTVAVALIRKAKIGELLDCAALALAAGISLGRLGSLFTDSNLGVIVENEKLQFFPLSSYSEAEGVWRTPLYLYEALLTALIFFVLLYYFKKQYKKMSINGRFGDIFALFLILYPLVQGVFECRRSDPLMFPEAFGSMGVIHMTHALGALVAALALCFFIFRNLIERKAFLYLIACAMACGSLYLGYFYAELQMGTINQTVNLLWQSISTAGLIYVGMYSYKYGAKKAMVRK